MVQVLRKGRFVEVPGARVRPLASNAWEITIPRTDAVRRACGRGVALEDWDGAIFVVNDLETEPAIASGMSRDVVRVTVVVL